MKHTFKKVLATISAAAMCAVPTINAFTASAATSDHPRYTLRRAYFVKSAANIPGIRTALVGTMNVYEIINHTNLILTKAAVEKIEEVYA